MAKTMKTYGPAAMHATATTMWTTPASSITALQWLTIVNTGANTRTVQIAIGTLGAGTYIVNESIAPGATIHRFLGDRAGASVTIQETQGAGTDCTITLGYDENTVG